MIKQETIVVNGKQLIKTYSDNNKYIIQNETGIDDYTEAIDIPNKYTYTESKKDINLKEANGKKLNSIDYNTINN